MGSSTRQRDILPLPSVPAPALHSDKRSKTSRRRACSLHKTVLTNSVIASINALGFDGSVAPSYDCASSAQIDSLDRIRNAVDLFGKPPAGLSTRRALSELCASSPMYSGSSSRRPYNEELVSWPPVGTTAVDPFSVLTGEPLDLLQAWNSKMLRPQEEAAALLKQQGLTSSYSCPILIRPTRSMQNS